VGLTCRPNKGVVSIDVSIRVALVISYTKLVAIAGVTDALAFGEIYGSFAAVFSKAVTVNIPSVSPLQSKVTSGTSSNLIPV